MSYDANSTRFSQSLGLQLQAGSLAQQTSCLVRIYPAEGIGESWQLDDECLVIGRDVNCDVTLPDDSVSRRHAQVELIAGGYQVTDLESTNGTYVNDQRVEARRLRPGDRLRLGNQILKFLSTDRMEAAYHETIYKIMTTDGLTQAYNKRYFLEVADREFLRAQRNGQSLAVLMIDADRFKSVNDTYGHLAGDEVLSELCRRVRAELRRDEVLARYGGEEFILLLPDATLSQAVEAGERVRQAVAATAIQTEQAALHVTVSIGAAATERQTVASVIELIEIADGRLYAAKQGGRNRVEG